MSVLIDSYSESNQSDQNTIINIAGYLQNMGQSFTGNGGILDYVQFYAKKYGSLTGNVYAYIYAVSGVFGESNIYTGSPLAVSDAVDGSTIGVSFALQSFIFSGANKIVLANGTHYAVVAFAESTTVRTGLTLGLDNSSPTHSGNCVWHYDASYGYDAAVDLCFYVYGDSVDTPIVGNKYAIPPFKNAMV